jgi:predicted acyltransferase (DUF342 family)
LIVVAIGCCKLHSIEIIQDIAGEETVVGDDPEVTNVQRVSSAFVVYDDINILDPMPTLVTLELYINSQSVSALLRQRM